MVTKAFIQFLMCINLLCSSIVYAADTLSFSTLEYCPLSCVPEKEEGREGIMVDIIRYIAQKNDITLTIDLLPFNRYLAKATDDMYDGLLVMGKDHMPDLVYPSVTAGGHNVIMAVKKENPWEYTGIESLKKVMAGTVANFKYCSDELGPYLNNPKPDAKVEPVSGDFPVKRNLLKLLRDRIDVYLDGELSVRYTAHRLKKADAIRIIDPGKCEYLNYTAFNPKKPASRKWADLYEKELIAMRDNGELQKIMSKYGLIAKLK